MVAVAALAERPRSIRRQNILAAIVGTLLCFLCC
uniref:Uncharacterized protein n=1 Tax=Zea mays TaxID=4577 RepID=C4J1F2_MAIZE|nr:unknown [Zea mays]